MFHDISRAVLSNLGIGGIYRDRHRRLAECHRLCSVGHGDIVLDLSELDAFEEAGIERLRWSIGRLHPDSIRFEKFSEILLQRYWVSQEFTHIYDAGQDRLTAQAATARPAIRRIIREEYPNNRGAWVTSSHREDLVTDLINIGISWDQFIASRRSRTTSIVVSSARNIVYGSAEKNFADLRILAFLRCWGEVLTAVEYELLYPRIQRLLGGKPSVFYDHHAAHDARKHSLASLVRDRGALTHADKLGRELVELIRIQKVPALAIETAFEITELAIENKVKFYKQF